MKNLENLTDNLTSLTDYLTDVWELGLSDVSKNYQ